jgi:hypothetical protein
MNTIIILLAFVFFITTIILFIRGFEFVKRIEKLEDLILQYDLREEQTRDTLETMLNQMREIDLRGSFESDDEVGSVFTELKNIIETYNNN